MGQLIDGVWDDQDGPYPNVAGHFERPISAFRNWITPDGRPGPTGHDGFAAAPGRYHLYVSLACPGAHQTLIMRVLKGLELIVPLSVTHWLLADGGWAFTPGEGVIPDPLFNSRFLHEIYSRGEPHYTGRVTVPVLWDRHTQSIVSNESADIVRMFNSAFDGVGAKAGDFCPKSLGQDLDALNRRVHDTVNNGVYTAGFATAQGPYEEAVNRLFESFDWLESRLSQSRFLYGDVLTEADIRLFTTLVRFDLVYSGQFKCNLRRLADYKHLWAYTRDIYQRPGIARTVNVPHIKQHYYLSYRLINPNGIVPVGPEIDFDRPAERGKDIARLLTF